MSIRLRLRPLLFLAPALAVALLSGCAPRTVEKTPEPTPPADKTPAPAPLAKPERLVGPVFTLVDTLDRPLECVIIAKQGGQVLVKRTSDQARYLIGLDRLSAPTRQLLGAYPDENMAELTAFADDRDYAEAKRSVRVEMISATWCGYCTQAKNFFSAEGVTYAAYDHESFQGKERKKTWKTDALPAVKIGDQIITGFNKESYTKAILQAYRQKLATAPRP